MLGGFFRKSGPTLPNTQIKQCSICGISGIPRGSYGLHRPLCCQPISICENCSHRKREILSKFRSLNSHCSEHSKAKIAEIEYINSLNRSKAWFKK